MHAGSALPPLDRVALGEGLLLSVLAAGAAILEIYAQDFAVEWKADHSPVTAADAAGEAIILADLARLAPGVPVVAEEEAAAGRVPLCGRRFFLVDPLDGTKEFVQRRGDFTVNIALIEEGVPTLGLVYAPARGDVFFGDGARGEAWAARLGPDGLGARRPLCVRAASPEALAVVASKSHCNAATDAYLAALPVGERVSCGSSLKFCLVADGEADVYPRLSPTMEWDTAAGDAVLRAAGGGVFGPDGAPLRYNKARFFNPGFVACGGVSAPPVGPFLKTE
ncbi:3'(2'),5'-bisphosphate nucleotidase CysQ [Sphingomonas morindae]|uniref:3'(2'),5'-bisphosphate nucleotidase CysQ n=1 Tax=Sphingomonas morindae TaxID=1541170 RepID=A0ABY4X528_9SPHN|nr:3'(2'),5'-bisphosphate nucleotidase CysQ [Sphingomonas morindae]USI71960.1 3'(2'),5'-bisphosphate nucleotidase CysQ [Sphingomonas morindae]